IRSGLAAVARSSAGSTPKNLVGPAMRRHRRGGRPWSPTPTATANWMPCPEGWSFHRLPGPGFVNVPQMSVESSYYTWVDQHDTLGLGANVPIATGNLFDGVHAFVNGKFVTLRIPYPLGFYAKGLDGRIDDAAAGWKGRGIWITSGDRTPWHKEGGKGTKPMVVHFQVRPSPLAD